MADAKGCVSPCTSYAKSLPAAGQDLMQKRSSGLHKAGPLQLQAALTGGENDAGHSAQRLLLSQKSGDFMPLRRQSGSPRGFGRIVCQWGQLTLGISRSCQESRRQDRTWQDRFKES